MGDDQGGRMERYKHSVIDVCMRLNGDLQGSGDPIPDEEARELVAWLKWRIGAGWERSAVAECTGLDNAIRDLADITVGTWEGKYGKVQAQDPDDFIESFALADMLWSGEVFPSTAGETVGLLLNCSDTFAWGCADAEPFTLEDIPALYAAWQTGIYGTTLWVCKRRGQRPQKPLEERMRAAGSWDDEMEALP